MQPGLCKEDGPCKGLTSLGRGHGVNCGASGLGSGSSGVKRATLLELKGTASTTWRDGQEQLLMLLLPLQIYFFNSNFPSSDGTNYSLLFLMDIWKLALFKKIKTL